MSQGTSSSFSLAKGLGLQGLISASTLAAYVIIFLGSLRSCFRMSLVKCLYIFFLNVELVQISLSDFNHDIRCQIQLLGNKRKKEFTFRATVRVPRYKTL